jgi:hypothetical protein
MKKMAFSNVLISGCGALATEIGIASFLYCFKSPIDVFNALNL